MPNTTPAADNGARSMSEILQQLGGDQSLLDGPQAISTDPLADPPEEPVNLATEGEKAPQRDDSGRFTKADPKDELPAILQDAKPEETATDEEIDKLLEPLSADEKENARRGISKLVNRLKTQEQEHAERVQKMQSWEQALTNPETAEDALAQLAQQVRQLTGKAPQATAQPAQTGKAPNPNDYVDSEGNCDWGKWSADMLSVATQQAEAKVRADLGQELEPLKGFYTQTKAEREAVAKAEGALPSLQSEFGSWVTPEMVRTAVQKYPSMSVAEAFGATHYKAIAQQFAKHGQSLAKTPKREMLSSEALTTRETVRAPGQYVSMDEILQQLSVE